MKALLRKAAGIAHVIMPVMCRCFGCLVIANGIVFCVIGVFLALSPQHTPVWKALLFLGGFGIALIVMGVVIFKWFTRFMMWNLQRCMKTWGFDQQG